MVADQEKITVFEETSATALWSDGSRCHGVITDQGLIAAKATLLASGGAAALWRRTSNPWGAIGAGSVLAHAAGAELADLEFCQFHPTCVSAPGTSWDGALITEAIRGEGAVLLDVDGEGEEVDARSGRIGCTSRYQTHCVAREHHHGAVGLDRQFPSLNAEDAIP
mgnify:CR=1 FL=1